MYMELTKPLGRRRAFQFALKYWHLPTLVAVHFGYGYAAPYTNPVLKPVLNPMVEPFFEKHCLDETLDETQGSRVEMGPQLSVYFDLPRKFIVDGNYILSEAMKYRKDDIRQHIEQALREVNNPPKHVTLIFSSPCAAPNDDTVRISPIDREGELVMVIRAGRNNRLSGLSQQEITTLLAQCLVDTIKTVRS